MDKPQIWHRIDADKIRDLDDVRAIIKVMNLQVEQDRQGFPLIRHLLKDN